MYIKCPVTGMLLSTGIDTNDTIPETLTSQEITCFYCDNIHTWEATDVIFLTTAEGKDQLDNLNT